MTLWDVVLLWLVAKLFGGGKTTGPDWPGPTGPTGPGPTGPTGPGPTGPGPTGPGPTGPAGGTTWKPYYYVQPDAGAKYGTPYALAAQWHGKGTAWKELYNLSKNRPISETSSSWSPEQRALLEALGRSGNAAAKAASKIVLGDDADESQPDDPGKKTPTGSYADVGDKLLVPWTWPEPSDPAIVARLQPIPAGTALPGEPKVSGDETPETI